MRKEQLRPTITTCCDETMPPANIPRVFLQSLPEMENTPTLSVLVETAKCKQVVMFAR